MPHRTRGAFVQLFYIPRLSYRLLQCKKSNPFQLITTQSRIEVQSCRNSSTYGGPYIEQGWSVPPSVELLRQDCIGILDSKQSSCNPESTRNSNDNCSTDRGPVIEQGWQRPPTKARPISLLNKMTSLNLLKIGL